MEQLLQTLEGFRQTFHLLACLHGQKGVLERVKFLVKLLKLLWVAADWRVHDQRSVKGIGEGEVQVLLGV